METLPSNESSAMIAVRMAAHNLRIRSRKHCTLPSPVRISTEQWMKAHPTTLQRHDKPKKKVQFDTDENECVKVSMHHYECCKSEDTHFTAEEQINLSLNTKLEGRRFYRLHRQKVIELERCHQECSVFHWSPDAQKIDFFGQWAGSVGRGLERRVSKQQVFHEERLRHASAVLVCQEEARRMKATLRHIADALRQTSLDFSQRSRVFAFHMAAGDAVVARLCTVEGESVVARSA